MASLRGTVGMLVGFMAPWNRERGEPFCIPATGCERGAGAGLGDVEGTGANEALGVLGLVMATLGAAGCTCVQVQATQRRVNDQVLQSEADTGQSVSREIGHPSAVSLDCLDRLWLRRTQLGGSHLWAALAQFAGCLADCRAAFFAHFCVKPNPGTTLGARVAVKGLSAFRRLAVIRFISDLSTTRPLIRECATASSLEGDLGPPLQKGSPPFCSSYDEGLGLIFRG